MPHIGGLMKAPTPCVLKFEMPQGDMEMVNGFLVQARLIGLEDLD